MDATLSGRTATTWSPARVYLVVSGVFLVVASAVGFAANAAFPATSDAVHSAGSAHVFGIFETNGWHNLSAGVSGAIALAFALRPQWARAGSLAKGYMYAAVTTAIALWGPETFRIASNAADQVVHAALGVTGLVAGYATPRPRS